MCRHVHVRMYIQPFVTVSPPSVYPLCPWPSPLSFSSLLTSPLSLLHLLLHSLSPSHSDSRSIFNNSSSSATLPLFPLSPLHPLLPVLPPSVPSFPSSLRLGIGLDSTGASVCCGVRSSLSDVR